MIISVVSYNFDNTENLTPTVFIPHRHLSNVLPYGFSTTYYDYVTTVSSNSEGKQFY